MIIAITDKTADHLNNYLKAYHKVSGPDNLMISTVLKGHKVRMSVGNVERIIKKYAAQIRSKYQLSQNAAILICCAEPEQPICIRMALNLFSRILGHSLTETTRIYAVPSVDVMRKVMESGNLESDEKSLWTDDEDEIARICGLR